MSFLFRSLPNGNDRVREIMKHIKEKFPSLVSETPEPKPLKLFDTSSETKYQISEPLEFPIHKYYNSLFSNLSLANDEVNSQNLNEVEKIENFDDQVLYFLFTDLETFIKKINILDEIRSEDQIVLCSFLKKLFEIKELDRIEKLESQFFLQEIKQRFPIWQQNIIKKRKVKAIGSIIPIFLKKYNIKLKEIVPELNGNDLITNAQIDKVLKSEEAKVAISEILEKKEESEEYILNHFRDYFIKNISNWKTKIFNGEVKCPTSIRLTFLPRNMQMTRQHIQLRIEKIRKNLLKEPKNKRKMSLNSTSKKSLNSTSKKSLNTTSKTSLSSKTICKKNPKSK